MTVPTIVTVTPRTGSTMGSELIEIYGTGFRTPSVPDTIPVPVQPQTVEVLIGGVKSRRVGVANDNRLLVFTPPHAEAVSGSLVTGVDVVVRNIDDDGVLIPGETVTAAAAFTYQLPQLNVLTPLQFLVDWFMRCVSEQVHPEVVLSQHTDWDDTPGGTSMQSVAKFPAIVLDGPKLVENRFYGSNQFDIEQIEAAEEFFIKRETRTVDVGFSVLILSDNVQEILNLASVLTEWLHLNKVFPLPTDINDPDPNVATDLELDFAPGGDFVWAGEPNEHNVRQMRGSILIRPFDVTVGPAFTRAAALGAKGSDPDVTLASGVQLNETTDDGLVILPISGLTGNSPP